MADIVFSIERDGYDTIVLDSDGGKPYGLQKATTGLGVAPIEARFREGAADGGALAGERVALRPIDLGLMIFGTSRANTGANLRALANITRARRNQPLPRLVATYTTGEVYETQFSYVSGLELDYTAAMPEHVKVTLSIMADPFWTARDSISFTITNNGLLTGLLPDLAELPVASSFAIGDVPIVNPGDYESDVNWRITGPCSSVEVAINGVGYTITQPLLEGEVLLIDGTAKTLKDSDGVSRYDYFGPAPKFAKMQPGRSVVSVVMPGAQPITTSVTGYFRPRRELVF